MDKKFRTESDSIGELSVPWDAYYGVQSLRGARNFVITEIKVNPVFIRSIAKIKKAAAMVNAECGAFDKTLANAIQTACDEIIAGKFADQFICDAIQGGAGTSTNMNANEVIANRAIELLGGIKGNYTLCHPNDHVNYAQSTNDVIPTAGKMTAIELTKPLLSALDTLISAINSKAAEFDNVIKMGRTQLQDAVPIRLGQEFAAYSAVLCRDRARICASLEGMYTVNIGASAIGTCINVDPMYLESITRTLSEIAGYELKSADNLIDATQNIDAFVSLSGALKVCAVTLSKIANDLRLMSSGPCTGIGEINLPPMQNGSSIMPGKINPVIPEVVNQVAFLVIGHDATICAAAEAGQLELNAFEPVMFYQLFEAITAMTGAIDTFTKNCIKGITANEERCREQVEKSVGVITAMAPYIGYKRSALIAKEALRTGTPVRDIILRENITSEETLNSILDIFKMTEPREI